MDNYFESLLSKISKNKEKDEVMLENIETTTGTNNTSQPGIKKVVYTFIPIKLTNQGKIVNLSDKLSKIIKKVHDSLENKFTTSEEISQQIISKLVKYINKHTEYDIYILELTNKAKPFNLTGIFKQLDNYDLYFINPAFSVILQQIESNYLSTHHRTTLNQDLAYIINHYQSASKEQEHSLVVDYDAIAESFKHISSAFTNSNDYEETVDTFYNALTNQDTKLIVHSIVNLGVNIVDLSNISDTIAI